MKTEFNSRRDRSGRMFPEGWAFFRRPPSDLSELLRVYANKDSAEFQNDDEAITDLMVRKTLRIARWNYRLNFGRLLGAAAKRRGRQWYLKQVKPRWQLVLRKLRIIADAEELAQKPADLPEQKD